MKDLIMVGKALLTTGLSISIGLISWLLAGFIGGYSPAEAGACPLCMGVGLAVGLGLYWVVMARIINKL